MTTGSRASGRLDDAQSDRAAGVLLGQASGDALGAGYEFGSPLPVDVPVEMKGGGSFRWAPGEWTDDTAMSVPILEAAELAIRDGDSLTDHLDHVAARWAEWARTAPDVGVQTRSVLSEALRDGPVNASSLLAASRAHHERQGKSAGNGSLMRTSPVALAYLGDVDSMVAAARAVSELTHTEADAGDACVLWCVAIDLAVLEGALDVRVGLDQLPAERRALWAKRIAEAESEAAVHFTHNGWVVHAFQAAWSAIHHTCVPADAHARHLQLGLENAVRVGHDTDTVADIAGQLLGARWGASAVPAQWRSILHGWPGLTGEELAERGLAVARRS
jgi:ADP-ribosylglycohydrolase